MAAGYAIAATMPRVDARPGLAIADLDVAGPAAVHFDDLILLRLSEVVIRRAC
jgi:hypothetical protein